MIGEAQQFVLSTHVMSTNAANGIPVVIHRQNGAMLQATSELNIFLELFRVPLSVEQLQSKILVRDVESKIRFLAKIGFLLNPSCDEEKKTIKAATGGDDWKKSSSEHFIAYHPTSVTYPVLPFQNLLEKVYRFLRSKGFRPLRRKSIILVCDSLKLYRALWGDAPMPSGVPFFVTHGRILAMKPHIIYTLDFQDTNVFRAMAHEMVHIFLCQHYTHLPVWVVEGLCEYYGARKYNTSFKELLLFKKVFRFSDIERKVAHSLLDLDNSPVEYNIGYRQSLSFISYLINLVGEEKLMQCIFDTGLSKDFRTSFKERFSQPIDSYEDDWRHSWER